jgi:hypothetical protein
MFKIMNSTSSAPSQPDAIQSDPDIIPNHPLAAIAGKFEGELWNATLAEIQRLRRLDRQNSQSLIEDWTIDAGMN